LNYLLLLGFFPVTNCGDRLRHHCEFTCR